MNNKVSGIIFLVITLVSVTACSDSSTSNPAVAVDATGPSSGQEGQNIVVFATASTSDSSGGEFSYLWQQVGGPAALIANADSPTATIQIPLVPYASR